MKKLKGFKGLMLVAFALMLVIASIGYAALATESTSWTDSDVNEFNSYSPSATKTFAGERLKGLFTRETATITTGGSKDLDTKDKVIVFNTAADQGTWDSTYANGEPGQTVTFVLTTDNGNSVDITPITKTGFTSVSLSDTKDSCTLLYQDDTVGWVVAGNNACTIN